MDKRAYLLKIEEIVGAKFYDNSIDLQFPRQTVNEARLQKSKIDHMQKELRRIKKVVNVEMDNLKSTYQGKRANIRPKWFTRIAYPAAIRSRDQQRERIMQEEYSALKPLRTVSGMIDGILFALDRVKHDIEDEIEKGTVEP